MVNTYSPALEFYPLETATPSAAPAVKYPSVPPALRLLRLQFRVLAAVSTEWAFRAAWRLFCTPRQLPVKKWEAQALADSQPFWVDTPAGRVAAYEWNPTGARTVLLVHGWEHRASFWGAAVAALTAAGYRVVALDGPAHGASAGRRTTLPAFGQAVQAVADHVGAVHAVVAHSFGAAATAGLPVRFNADGQLPRLVLLSVPASTRAVAERFAALLHLPAAVVERMGSFIREQHGRSVESFNLTTTGHTLPVGRALLLHDRTDANVPFADAEAIAASWPALDFRPTRGLGHNRIMRDADVLRQVVDFIGAG